MGKDDKQDKNDKAERKAAKKDRNRAYEAELPGSRSRSRICRPG